MIDGQIVYDAPGLEDTILDLFVVIGAKNELYF
jgi:hypothetical protein